MIENVSDFFSILILLCIPVLFLIAWIVKKLSHRKEKLLTTSEKYYREW